MKVKTILNINVNDETHDDIFIDVYDGDNVIMVDFEGHAVEFSRTSAIAAARAILKHFGEGLE